MIISDDTFVARGHTPLFRLGTLGAKRNTIRTEPERCGHAAPGLW